MNIKEPREEFYGYTIDQIRQMDVWFRKNLLSWQVLDERWREGFKAGVEADRKLIQEHIDALMGQVKGK